MKEYENISLDRNSDEPLYQQVYNGIRVLIENGSIPPDDKLPTIRNLASKLGVNNVTIVNAYKMLEQRGYVYSKVGSGTYVKGIKIFKAKTDGIKNNSIEMMEHGYIKINLDAINFSTSTPNPRYFPVNEFKDALNEVLDRDGGFAFTYQESQGYFPLRENIRGFLEKDNIISDINNIHIISGAQQGIDIISKTLIGFNDTIIMESPTYTGATAAFKLRGANIIEIPILDDGIDMKELEEVLKVTNPKLIYVMTSFQNPTGVSYSEDKKLQLLYLAEKYNLYILEDDYLSELRFYGSRSLPIKALDANNRVIYLKSFSKIFMPGVRLGFIVTPTEISKDVLSAKHNTDISTSGLMQRAFDLYLKKGKWEQHMDIMWNMYKERYDTIIQVLERETPFFKFKKPDGGIHLWITCDVDSTILSSTGISKGVLVAPGRIFYFDERKSNNFRISIADVEKNDIEKGINILKDSYMEIKNGGSENIMPFL